MSDLSYGIGAMDGFMFAIILAVVVLLIVCFSTDYKLLGRKSRQYRKYVADMYVAAKVRWFAKQDGLDLANEEAEFKTWSKKSKSKDAYDVDETAEEHLKERIDNHVNTLDEIEYKELPRK